MIQAITAQESAAALRVLAQLLDQGMDLRAYCAEVVEYLRNMLVVSVVTSPQEWQGLIEASAEDLAQMAADARSFSPEPLQELFAIFTQAEDSCSGSVPILGSCSKQRPVRATRLQRRRADGKATLNRCSQPRRHAHLSRLQCARPAELPARSADPTSSLRHRGLLNRRLLHRPLRCRRGLLLSRIRRLRKASRPNSPTPGLLAQPVR